MKRVLLRLLLVGLVALALGCNRDDCGAIASNAFGALALTVATEAGLDTGYTPGIGCGDESPPVGPQSLSSPGACDPVGGDGSCVVCAKAWCCQDALACIGGCVCLVEERGASSSSSSACKASAAEFDAYGVLDACLGQHCRVCGP